jgi:transcriptional regulator with XRE-family HTH domain
MTALGDRVRQVREERGWTQTELAKRAKIPQSSISTLESGQTKGSPHIVEIALALGVSVYWLRSNRGPKSLTQWQQLGLDLTEPEQQAVQAYIQFLRAGKVA